MSFTQFHDAIATLAQSGVLPGVTIKVHGEESSERLLALLTGVLLARFICSRLFLKFCLGKMAECMEFHDYFEVGVHDFVREGTPAASWAKAKMRLTKSLRHLGD